MELKRYKKPIIIFLIYFAVFTFFGIMPLINPMSEQPLSNFLPGDVWGIEMFFLFGVFMPLGAIIGTNVLGYLFAPILLFVQKKFLGRKLEYGIQSLERGSKFNLTLHSFFPTLLAINIAMVLAYNPTLQDLLNEMPIFPELITFIILMIGTLALSLGLFSGVWFLTDGGIVKTNRNKIENNEQPIEINAIGGFYEDLLKGYAGIGVLFTYYSFFMTLVPKATDIGSVVMMIVFLIPFPVLISLGCIPAMILLDSTFKQRKAFTIKCAKNLGIVDFLDINIEKKSRLE
ncbi:MAG: hypothetical protein ACFFCS_17410 [Candidatus Hodarchaeota archaeon]